MPYGLGQIEIGARQEAHMGSSLVTLRSVRRFDRAVAVVAVVVQIAGIVIAILGMR